MKQLKGIVLSPVEPSKDYLWVNEGKIRAHSNGKWQENDPVASFKEITTFSSAGKYPVFNLLFTKTDGEIVKVELPIAGHKGASIGMVQNSLWEKVKSLVPNVATIDLIKPSMDETTESKIEALSIKVNEIIDSLKKANILNS